MEFVIVSGLSGAGKSKAIDVLEDMGFFCVDNVPPQMLGKFTELNQTSQGHGERMALVIDARSGTDLGSFRQELEGLRDGRFPFRLFFLDASNAVLLNRYKENRRKHPLLNNSSVLSLEQAITQERLILAPVRQLADFVIDTTLLTPSQLEHQLKEIFSQQEGSGLTVQCMSFGFKFGSPMEADLVFDVRCLPNPFYVEDLRERTGLEQPVCDYIFSAPESRQLREKLLELVDFLYPLYVREGKNRLVVAMGCTGGKHRSVAFAQTLAGHLRKQGIPVVTNHRDKDKPNRH